MATVKTINVTPTWTGTLNALWLLYTSGDRQLAEVEMRTCAQIADNFQSAIEDAQQSMAEGLFETPQDVLDHFLQDSQIGLKTLKAESDRIYADRKITS